MAVGAIRISEDVLRVLSAAEITGNALALTGQLDRKLYEQTNKVLDAAGGKWNRKAKAHLFDGDAAEAIEPIILTGEYTRTKQEFGQFDSPPDVVRRVIELADIRPGMLVLEPSAGVGNLALAAHHEGGIVTAWEIDPNRFDKLKSLDIWSETACPVLVDALQQDPYFEYAERFDRVVMNPPFARQDDIRHVIHAANFLKDGGRLVAVMSASVLFRDNKLTTDFRAFVEACDGTIERLPEDSFKESGTSVNTCVVSFNV
ncbi:N-6 DNA methylase [Pseudaminobacter sp. 19-2017]|uniref:site-specific DNA-methyltransferase (adenine-specific) n=1 Tax=Pseudaminobacter soli (ex Zhang et al. 2022) TaxID=2831468 RepID=A0A942E0X0_9HYPH|nr:methyltransferase [Pseudaminobacter soli]MBS3648835.1 N-6 DNA methylase [Pseudaminobacter soli]